MQFSELYFYSQAEPAEPNGKLVEPSYSFIFSRPISPGIDLDASRPTSSLRDEDPFDLIAKGEKRPWIDEALMQGVDIPPWVSFMSITECEVHSLCDLYILSFSFDQYAVDDVKEGLLAFSDHLLAVLRAKEVEPTVEFA